MNACLIGDNLTSLALAKVLTNKKIKVFLYHERKTKYKIRTRTIGISKSNLKFFNNEIIQLKKNATWKINQIEIYNENIHNEKILNLKDNKDHLFSIVKNDYLYKLLNNSLNKNFLFKKILIKNNLFYKKILKNKNYDLIINCERRNKISKDYFFKKIIKSYNSKAYTGILKHKNCINKKAIQIFTKFGPLAFLPFSKNKTSIVFSIDNKQLLTEEQIKKIILKNNINYKIQSITNLEKFDLNFSFNRQYYYKNILLFGDSLHQIHPLAGQGFNMTLRDLNILSKLIDKKLNLGLKVDNYIYKEFEDTTKHLNYIFSTGIDFIYEFFNFKDKIYLSKLIRYLGKNKFFNKIFKRSADRGIII